MIVKDHINIMGFAGNSPLQGPNDQRYVGWSQNSMFMGCPEIHIIFHRWGWWLWYLDFDFYWIAVHPLNNLNVEHFIQYFIFRFGPRFPPMSKAYDSEIIRMALETAKEMGISSEVHTGVYTCLGGPNYETVAELKMWKMLGVDAVGMSTVSNCIVFISQ